jgi:hypothetical protein
MNLKEHQYATGSGMIAIQNGIITINDEYLERVILTEVLDKAFPSSIDINTPVIVNSDETNDSYQLVITCSVNYVQGVTINNFQGCVVDEDCKEYKIFIDAKLENSIENSIFYHYNNEQF